MDFEKSLEKKLIKMGIIFSNKEILTNNIDCGGNFNVRFSLTAAPDIVTNPTDIILVLDRSGIYFSLHRY